MLNPSGIDYIAGDETSWDPAPLETLAHGANSRTFHAGFWQPMDTLRDKNRLEGLWIKGRALEGLGNETDPCAA